MQQHVCWCETMQLLPNPKLPADAALSLRHPCWQVHFFQDIGYRHNSMRHCPSFNRVNCACDAMTAVRYHTPSYGRCHKAWDTFVASQPVQLRVGP